VQELAAEYDATMAQIALAWILGRTASRHRSSARRAWTTSRRQSRRCEIDLSSSDVEYLEEPYEAVRVPGHE